LAASASGDNGLASMSAAPMAGNTSVPAASSGFQDLRPVASAAGPEMAPGRTSEGAVVKDPSAPEDEIDSRTKSQMDAAWSNWREIRNTIVTPQLTEQLAEVAAASANGGLGEQSANLANGTPDSASIASIVDSVLAEMRPKLVEEIARKLAAKKE